MSLFTATTLISLSCGPGQLKKDAPNVLLITIDTLRADHVSRYGYARETTPNIDALGNRGAVFTNAKGQATATIPSVVSIFTSRYPDDTGSLGNGLPLRDPKIVTLTQILRDHGYRTGAVVSNFLLQKGCGLERGFEDYDDYFPSHELNSEYLREKPPKVTTTIASDWLRKFQKERFFLWVHYQGPHGPYTPAQPFDKLFLRKNYSNSKRLILSDKSTERESIPLYQRLGNHTEVDYYIDNYDGETRATDYWIGEMLNEMKRLGLFDNTLILITADHGESLGEHHWYFSHGQTSYEDEARVPLILYYPKLISEKSTIDIPVQGVDLMPTILDIVGLKSKSLRGVSLLPAIRHETLPQRKYPLLGQSENGFDRALYEGDWKLIVNLKEPRTEELYNLHQDPGESVNLVQNEKERADTMRGILEKYMTKKYRKGIEFESLDKEHRENLKALGYIN